MSHLARSLVVVTAALLATVASSTAAAKPSAEDVSRARAECRAHKTKVQAAEKKDGADPQLAAMKLEWEHACLKAQLLLDEREGAEPPAPAPAPG